MEIFISIFVCYGITNILVFGSIFSWLRKCFELLNPGFLGELFTCPMCLSVWVGVLISFTYYSPTNHDMLWLRFILDAGYYSGTTWILHTVQEFFEK